MGWAARMAWVRLAASMENSIRPDRCSLVPDVIHATLTPRVEPGRKERSRDSHRADRADAQRRSWLRPSV
jgi:hypothetical protein